MELKEKERKHKEELEEKERKHKEELEKLQERIMLLQKELENALTSFKEITGQKDENNEIKEVGASKEENDEEQQPELEGKKEGRTI